MSKHVAIIGGGVVGLATAYYCLQRGFRVTVIDGQPRQRDGCSYGNAGMVVPSHFVPLAAPGMIRLGLKWMWNPESPFFIRPRVSWELLAWLWKFRGACKAAHVQRSAPLLRDLHLASRAEYLKLAADLPAGFGLQERGLLMLCKSAETFHEETEAAEMAEELDVPVRVLSSSEVAEQDSSIEMNVSGAVYYPRDCHLNPNRLMTSLQDQLADQGCEFAWETQVTGFATDGDRVRTATSSQGEIAADEFVLCGGAWTSQLARKLDLRLLLQAGKGYSLTLPTPAQLPAICAILCEARVAVTPLGSTLRFGGTMEICGLDQRVTPSRVRGIIRSIPDYYPRFREADFEGVTPWAGLRPCSPDGLPYFGRSARWQNVLVSAGHAMMGLSLAPISGKLAADIISGAEPTDLNLDLLSPDRFASRL